MAKEGAIRVDTSEFKMSYFDADKFKTQEEVAMETHAVLPGT